MQVSVKRRAGPGETPPARFQLNGTDYIVEEVLDHWFGADSTYYKVQADDGNLYILRHRPSKLNQDWTLESFRREGITLAHRQAG